MGAAAEHPRTQSPGSEPHVTRCARSLWTSSVLDCVGNFFWCWWCCCFCCFSFVIDIYDKTPQITTRSTYSEKIANKASRVFRGRPPQIPLAVKCLAVSSSRCCRIWHRVHSIVQSTTTLATAEFASKLQRPVKHPLQFPQAVGATVGNSMQ